eukprot:CCRYP_006539-RA/>CCRYP_006539-RA protein AED:0.00 eAED:0.00 QI:0/1/1/1/0/0/2/111/47
MIHILRITSYKQQDHLLGLVLISILGLIYIFLVSAFWAYLYFQNMVL